MTSPATGCGSGWASIEDTFYDADLFAMLPMGFCYPGKGKGGDLPPRPECAANWRQPLLDRLPHIELTLVIGQYAQAWHLGEAVRPDAEGNRGELGRRSGPPSCPCRTPARATTAGCGRIAFFEAEVIPALQAPRPHADRPALRVQQGLLNG